MDVGFMGAIGTMVAHASLPWSMPGSAIAVGVVVWFAGVAVLGTLLGRLRLWAVDAQDGWEPNGGAASLRLRGAGALTTQGAGASARAWLLLVASALLGTG